MLTWLVFLESAAYPYRVKDAEGKYNGQLLNEPMESKFFQNKVLVVDTHVAVPVELNTDGTFRFSR